MTFSKAKPAGWTDNIDTPNAAQLGTIDTNQSRAIDGAAGGAYAPTNPVQINGAGLSSDNLLSSTITGILQRAPNGRLPRRFNTSTIIDNVAPVIVDMTYDVYYAPAGHLNNLTVRLATATGQLPTTGDVLKIVRDGNAGAVVTLVIESEAAPGVPIATIPDGPGAWQASTLYSASFWWDGLVWRSLRWSNAVS